MRDDERRAVIGRAGGLACFTLLVLVAAPSRAGDERRTYLEDCAGHRAILESLGLAAYERGVDAALGRPDATDPDGPWVRVLTLPSFESEWAVTAWTGSGIVELHEAEESMWDASWSQVEGPEGSLDRQGSAATASVPVTSRRGRLRRDLARDLQALWGRVLEAPSDSADMGEDGVVWLFTSSGAGSCRLAWSPRDGTAAGALVEVAETLRARATAPPGARRRASGLQLQVAMAEAARLLERAAEASREP